MGSMDNHIMAGDAADALANREAVCATCRFGDLHTSEICEPYVICRANPPTTGTGWSANREEGGTERSGPAKAGKARVIRVAAEASICAEWPRCETSDWCGAHVFAQAGEIGARKRRLESETGPTGSLRLMGLASSWTTGNKGGETPDREAAEKTGKG